MALRMASASNPSQRPSWLKSQASRNERRPSRSGQPSESTMSMASRPVRRPSRSTSPEPATYGVDASAEPTTTIADSMTTAARQLLIGRDIQDLHAKAAGGIGDTDQDARAGAGPARSGGNEVVFAGARRHGHSVHAHLGDGGAGVAFERPDASGRRRSRA